VPREMQTGSWRTWFPEKPYVYESVQHTVDVCFKVVPLFCFQNFLSLSIIEETIEETYCVEMHTQFFKIGAVLVLCRGLCWWTVRPQGFLQPST
jgi:hypothetical protein